MSVSQKQLADVLGLSIITVSIALRNHPDLAEATKAKILHRARQLGYSRLRSAKKSSPSYRVCILLYPGADDQYPLERGVKLNIFTDLQRECRRLNAETLVEMPAPSELPSLITNHTVDAVALMGRYTPAVVAKLRDIPTLAVSSYIEDQNIPRIVADNLNGMRLATEHLISLGHRNIIFIGEEELNTQLHRERAHGYLIAMHKYNLAPQIHFSDRDNLTVLDSIPKSSALVCSCDALAVTAWDRLLAKGWKLPDDCSVVSFDNMDEFTPRYALTTYGPNWAYMGRFAANLLVSQASSLQGEGVVITIPGQLIIRKSAIAAGTVSI